MKLHIIYIIMYLIWIEQKLYDRINKRVDIMFEKGLLEEVKNLKAMGLTDDMQSMKV